MRNTPKNNLASRGRFSLRRGSAPFDNELMTAKVVLQTTCAASSADRHTGSIYRPYAVQRSLLVYLDRRHHHSYLVRPYSLSTRRSRPLHLTTSCLLHVTTKFSLSAARVKNTFPHRASSWWSLTAFVSIISSSTKVSPVAAGTRLRLKSVYTLEREGYSWGNAISLTLHTSHNTIATKK